jgi:hypothetical protein
MQPTLTREQAIAKVDARAREAFAQLPEGSQLRLFADHSDLPCDETGGVGDRRFHEMVYAVDPVPQWPVAQVIPTLVDYWAASGYRVVRDDRDEPKIPQYFVEHPDGFRIGVSATHRDNGRVDVYLTSSSPCM